METLQAYWLSRPELGDKLVEAARGLAPEAASIAGPEATTNGPLAMACLAHDAGSPIEVESEYLPKHLPPMEVT